MAMFVLLLGSLWGAAVADMYDSFNAEQLPPSKCTGGCADWSSHTSIFSGGKVPAEAGNKCANVGSQVNSKPYGSWCFCSKAPGPAPAPSKDHPFDGKSLSLKTASDGTYVSFAYSDAPPGVSAGTEPMRTGYTAATDAMPLLFKAVEGKANTYTMYNQYTGYEKYVSFTWTDNYMRADYTTESQAMPTEFVEVGDGTYVMINQFNDARGKGLYVNLDDSNWLQTEATDQKDALVVSLEAAQGPGAGGGGDWDYCQSGEAVPEQVNVQIAGPDSVVISWITFEKTAPTDAPTLSIGKSAKSLSDVKGVTHSHKAPSGDRVHYMHFARATGLSPRERYYYRVKSGGKGAKSSAETYSFRAPYASGETKIDIYGDMGIYQWNNLEQLYQDCAKGTAADLIVHMGDISYNMGDDDERRADGFFKAFEKTIANCPWLVTVGNHEYYSGEELSRYLDGQWQKWGPIAGEGDFAQKYASTATSTLGDFLSTGTHHGPGTLGSNPSHTSRYFSVDMGLTHLIALDLNLYYGLDPCGDPCKKAQLEWLEKDLQLANQNRKAVPWVLAFSHYPLYCSGCNAKQGKIPSMFYSSDEAELCGNDNQTAADKWAAAQSTQDYYLSQGFNESMVRNGLKSSATASSDAIIADFHPLFEKYSLDLYLAGHWHYYESLWPISSPGDDDCKACGKPAQKSFNTPHHTVHVTTGNGGPPGKDSFCESGASAPDCNSIPSTRKQTNEYSYGQVIAHNSTHLTFKQIMNKDGSLFDEWTIYQPKHPFAAAEEEVQV